MSLSRMPGMPGGALSLSAPQEPPDSLRRNDDVFVISLDADYLLTRYHQEV
jgi:hypothetical protein